MSDDERPGSKRSPVCRFQHDGDISASWLSALLRAHGHLVRGEVRTLAVEHWRRKRLSDLYRLHATYAEAVDLPERFVLKCSRSCSPSSVAERRRWKEHEFYTRLVPLTEGAPVPQSFAACLAPDASNSLLLLEDLSPTHVKPPSLPLEGENLSGAIDCLAFLHAAWWEDRQLRQAALTRDEAWLAAKTASTRRLIARFLAESGAEIAPAARRALTEVAAAWPVILRRGARSSLTVVHGDAHPWNFLMPRDPERDGVRLLDWEAWAIEPGPYDLASLLALHVPGHIRAAQEAMLLARYVDWLQQHGVVGYDLAACRADYRWAIARKMMAPAGMWSRGSRARVWQPMLERITAAYDEQRCAELLSA